MKLRLGFSTLTDKMLKLEMELLYEIEWRTNELSIIRTIPLLCYCTQKQIDVLEKYSVVAIYSLWEGFVVNSFTLYIRELNNLNLTCDKIKLNILTHDIDMRINLKNGRRDVEKRRKFVDDLFKYTKSPIKISPKLPTESNVNYKVINNILESFYLSPLSAKRFKAQLNKLLTVRNNIAHGECSIPVDGKIIQEFDFTVQEAMHEVTNSIVEGFVNKTYLRE